MKILSICIFYLSATVVSNIDAESINLLYKVIGDKLDFNLSSQLINDISTTNETISDNYPPVPTTSDRSHTWLMH